MIAKCFVTGTNENNCSTFFQGGVGAILSKIKQGSVIHQVGINGSTKFIIKKNYSFITFLEFRIFQEIRNNVSKIIFLI